MSFYRSVMTAVAVLGLAGSVFAADAANMENAAADQAMQVATADTAGSSLSTATESKINMNTATAKELMQVKGMSSAKAKAIVSYRKKHGDFKSTEDLKMVKGFKKMKEEKMKAIADQLTVG